MNLYFVDAGEQTVAYDTASGYNIPEKGNVFSLVIALDRNRARLLFIKKHTYLDLDYTSAISVRQMRRDVEREAQVVEEDDPLWEAVDWTRTNYATTD